MRGKIKLAGIVSLPAFPLTGRCAGRQQQPQHPQPQPARQQQAASQAATSEQVKILPAE